MNAIAFEAQRMVREAAHPLMATETIKARLNRVARNLQYRIGDWRVRAAWYGEAGCWGAGTFRDLQNRYAAWKHRQEAKAHASANDATAALRALHQAYASSDPEFFRDQMEAIERAVGGPGAGTPSLDGGR